MNAGDCISLPRGLMHDAQNVGDEPSLHITVGLITIIGLAARVISARRGDSCSL